jgi:hypothetical protein
MIQPSAPLLRNLVFLLCLTFAWFAPRFGDRFFSAIERLGWRLAGRKTVAIVSLVLATIVIRLSLIWLIPPPVPRIEDEFSYLLAGDTYAHGRLTNLTHPLWVFFDTIHVNQHPTYMSKYPPAQGAVLALGEVLGSPWIGVILSAGAMCGAIVWMLQGWLPPRWALLGGILVMFQLGIFSYWMNSYWGGAVAAIGGALVAGAFPRIVRSWRARDAGILGLGAFILANSRPFDGFFLCLPVFFVLFVRICRTRIPSWRVTLPRVVVSVCMVVAPGGMFMAYYNWRVTGNALLMPYTVNERTYLPGTPLFSWQQMKAPIHFANPQFEELYSVFLRQPWAGSRVTGVSSAVRKMLKITVSSVHFFLWPALFVPVLALPWILRGRRVRLLVVLAALGLAELMLVAWFQVHYLGPLTAIIFALPLQGIRYLRLWRFRGRPVGIGVSRVVVMFVALLAPFGPGNSRLKIEKPSGIGYRLLFARQLDKTPGKHLVIVRYSPNHDVMLHEWVYNSADIDNSRVVWAREIPGLDLQPLLDYFRGRQIWVAEPDASPPRLTRQDTVAP